LVCERVQGLASRHGSWNEFSHDDAARTSLGIIRGDPDRVAQLNHSGSQWAATSSIFFFSPFLGSVAEPLVSSLEKKEKFTIASYGKCRLSDKKSDGVEEQKDKNTRRYFLTQHNTM